MLQNKNLKKEVKKMKKVLTLWPGFGILIERLRGGQVNEWFR